MGSSIKKGFMTPAVVWR